MARGALGAKEFVETWARRVTIPAAIVFAILLPLRYAVGRGVELGTFERLLDKWHFGVIRLINLRPWPRC